MSSKISESRYLFLTVIEVLYYRPIVDCIYVKCLLELQTLNLVYFSFSFLFYFIVELRIGI